MRKSDKILYWVPRIIGILAIAYISLFAADSFNTGRPFLEELAGFFVHLIPSFILLVLLLVSWKWELIGGILFTALGIGMSPVIYMQNYSRNHSVWISLGVILMFTFPFVIVGILFIANYYRKKRRKYGL